MGPYEQSVFEAGYEHGRAMEHKRMILILQLYFQKLSVEEIARKAGCSEEVVTDYISAVQGPKSQSFATPEP